MRKQLAFWGKNVEKKRAAPRAADINCAFFFYHAGNTKLIVSIPYLKNTRTAKKTREPGEVSGVSFNANGAYRAGFKRTQRGGGVNYAGLRQNTCYPSSKLIATSTEC